MTWVSFYVFFWWISKTHSSFLIIPKFIIADKNNIRYHCLIGNPFFQIHRRCLLKKLNIVIPWLEIVFVCHFIIFSSSCDNVSLRIQHFEKTITLAAVRKYLEKGKWPVYLIILEEISKLVIFNVSSSYVWAWLQYIFCILIIPMNFVDTYIHT